MTTAPGSWNQLGSSTDLLVQQITEETPFSTKIVWRQQGYSGGLAAEDGNREFPAETVLHFVAKTGKNLSLFEWAGYMEVGQSLDVRRPHDLQGMAHKNTVRSLCVEMPIVRRVQWGDGKTLNFLDIFHVSGEDREIVQHAPTHVHFHKLGTRLSRMEKELRVNVSEIVRSKKRKINLIAGAVGVLLGVRKADGDMDVEGDIYNFFVVTGSSSSFKQTFDPPLEIEQGSELALHSLSMGQTPVNVTKNILVKKVSGSAYSDFNLPPGFYGTVSELCKGLEVVSGLKYSEAENTLTGATVLLPKGIARALGYLNQTLSIISAFSHIATAVTLSNTEYIRINFDDTRVPNNSSYRVYGFFGDANFENMFVHVDIIEHMQVGAKSARVIQVIPFDPVKKFDVSMQTLLFRKVITPLVREINISLRGEVGPLNFSSTGENTFVFALRRNGNGREQLRE